MKIKTIVTLFLFTSILVACSLATTTIPRADNFAFVYEDFSCAPTPVYALDTTTSTVVYTPLGVSYSTTIAVQLTDDELEVIYQKAMSIGFFEYPSEFVIPEDQVIEREATTLNYRLSMTNGEMKTSVSWKDDAITKPGYAKADQLRELMKLINEIMIKHLDFRQLPVPKAVCA
jgi:hypothetical protein